MHHGPPADYHRAIGRGSLARGLHLVAERRNCDARATYERARKRAMKRVRLPYAAVFIRATILVFAVAVPLSACVTRAEEGVQEPGFCRQFNEVLEAAKEDFRAIEGRPKHEALGIWYATVSIPGGTDCLVYAPSLRMYACNLYMSDSESEAEAAYDDAVVSVRHCLPTDWRVRQRVDALGRHTKVWRNPETPVVHVTSSISDAAAYLVDVWVEAPTN